MGEAETKKQQEPKIIAVKMVRERHGCTSDVALAGICLLHHLTPFAPFTSSSSFSFEPRHRRRLLLELLKW